MTMQEKQEIAKKVNGLLGTGSLNWLTDFNRELKKEQFTIFFNKESEAKKAIHQLGNFNSRITKTPKFVNMYFKYGVTIIL
jgi:hypothetical protein